MTASPLPGHAVIRPSSDTKENTAVETVFVSELLNWNVVPGTTVPFILIPPVNTTPVGVPVPMVFFPVGSLGSETIGGIFTTSGTMAPVFPLYRVETPPLLSETQNGLVE